MPSIWRAVLTGDPYKINGMIICGTNPAVTDCDTQTVRKALSEIEFLVVVDLFMTETAKYADVVLPAAYEWVEYLYDEVSAIAHKQHPELKT